MGALDAADPAGAEALGSAAQRGADEASGPGVAASGAEEEEEDPGRAAVRLAVGNLRQMQQAAAGEEPGGAAGAAPAPVKAAYPPEREAPRTQPAAFVEGTAWVGVYGSNTPVFRSPEPVMPVGQVFFFRAVGQEDEQGVFARPTESAEKVDTRQKGEVVRVIDVEGSWVRLACETEAEVEEKWQGWMQSETSSGLLLEEIEDPAEAERQYKSSLFKRIWKVSDHIQSRLRDRTTARAKQYLQTGRVPPGKKDQLPEGTRCVNTFWGLEVRWIRLQRGEEYWPQGSLTLPESYVRSGWEQPIEECRQGHWRVFAARTFEANELVEVCPLVKVDTETCLASLQLRMNIVETPLAEQHQDSRLGRTGRVQSYVPLGYGMLYQQSVELEDVQINWKPVTNFNCRFVPVGDHMYIYATRRVLADEELILEYKRAFRTDEGEAIDFSGFTPYWCRPSPPEIFDQALAATRGAEQAQSVPGCVKFGKSQLHDRGIFTDAPYNRADLVEVCPCLVLDTNGAACMQDHCFQLPAVTVDFEGRRITKREGRFVLPCGYAGLYNHLEAGKGENVEWLYDETTQCFVFIATPPGDGGSIPRNTELCFDYGEAFWDTPSRRYQRPGAGARECSRRVQVV